MHSLYIYASLLALATPSLAQNTTSTNGTCGASFRDPSAPVNASAIVPIPFSPSWYLSVTLNDTRTATRESISLDAWISTPANGSTRACVYWITELLGATSTSNNGSCAGMLSDNCLDFLRGSVVLPDGAGDCPNLPGRAEVDKACGGSKLEGGNQVVFTTRPFNASNSTCTPDRIPGSSQPPESYIKHPLFGVTFGGAETNLQTNFSAYDAYVAQSMPWIVATDEDGESRTSVVCVRPGEVQAGSREPEKEPEKSGAGRVAIGWGVGVFGVVLAVL